MADPVPPTTGGPRPVVAGKAKVSSSDSKVWADTATQVAFRKTVLAAAIKSRVDRNKTQYSSLKSSELKKIPGSSAKLATAAAEPAGKYLAAAKKALDEAKVQAQARKDAAKAGKAVIGDSSKDDDILGTLDIKVTGYRSVESENKLWLKYFKGYYKRTGAARAKFADPHGKEAVKHMVKFIGGKKAPPGFSHHTEGVSIDFVHKRKVDGKVKWVSNSTIEGDNPGQLNWWYETWLYGWISEHADDYSFKELATEAWHYDYEK